MTDHIEVKRRVDDIRISDIQKSVHEIQADIKGLEKRSERSTDRINQLERDVIETKAAQNALESIMNSEHRRLSDMVSLVHDGVSKIGEQLSAHITVEMTDRKTLLKTLFSMLIAILGALGWFLFSQHSSGG